MKIINSLLTENPCYQAGKKITVKGLMLHSVGVPQPDASVFVKNWNKKSFDDACVHAFIDGNTGDVYQTLPWDHRGWHAGGSANNTHIGVEMCEPAQIKYTGGASFTCSNKTEAKKVAKRTYEAAVELFAELCKQFGLDPMKDIVGHAEGFQKGIASNHADPEHIWTGLGMKYTMDTFRKAVKAAMSAEKVLYRVQVGAFENIDNANKQLKKVQKAGFETYMVKVGKYYKIQVGAFGEKKNAEAVLKKVQAAGFEAFITNEGGEPVKQEVKQEVKKEIKVGSIVKLKKGAKTYQGGSLASFVYERNHKVVEINVDRVVIAYEGAVVAAVRKSDLTIV